MASRRSDDSDGSDGSDGVGWFQMVRSDKEFRFRRPMPLKTLQFRCQFDEPDGSDVQINQMGCKKARQKPEKPKEFDKL